MSQKFYEAVEEKWADRAKSNYTKKREEEPLLQFSIIFPQSVRDKIVKEILPQMQGEPAKNGGTKRATLAQYVREVVYADLSNRGLN